jgi:hypothetical protein
MSAAVVIALAGTGSSAGTIELLENVDIETVSRFVPHGIPGAAHPNGYADYWHHSQSAAWSNGTTDPVTSGIHSLYIPDTNTSGLEEMRSFATDIPGVGTTGRVLDLNWNWDWTITSGSKFSAFVRISDAPALSLDLGGTITDHVFFTDGSANSGGFQNFLASIPLNATDASFDIIFRSTEDPGGAKAETGTMFVDDISAMAPEPEPLAMLPGAPNQHPINRVDLMPNQVASYQMRDWRDVAQKFDTLVFDVDATGQYLPLTRIDTTPEFPSLLESFGIAAYVGETRTFGENGEPVFESLSTLGAVLGGSLVGIDKSTGPRNYVSMTREFFGVLRGEPLILNGPFGGSGGSGWYETIPSILFYSIADRYPNQAELSPVLDVVDDAFYDAVNVLTAGGTNPNFNHTAYNFKTQQPVFNGVWREPDMGMGMAWLQHAAYFRNKTADPLRAQDHLNAVDWSLQYYEDLQTNPDYEIMVPFGAYTAARMNAEHGGNYDIHKMVNWVFDRSNARPDKIMVEGTWDGQEVDGLMGFIRPNTGNDVQGYAFSMNTFLTAAPLVPLARYEDRYARAIGKWMLHAANAARLFYSDAHSAANQSSEFWQGDPDNVIAYEGLRHHWNNQGEELFAGGDPLVFGWGPETDFALYGGAYAGVFGAIIRETNQQQILQLDLLATDSFRNDAHPTFLYYNPFDTQKTVQVDVGAAPVDLYDAVSNRFIAVDVIGVASFSIPQDQAVILVEVPAGGMAQRVGRQLVVNGVVIDYNAALQAGNLLQNPDVDRADPSNPSRPFGWHDSLNAAWSDQVALSPTHSLELTDASAIRAEEWRSYATAVPGEGDTGRGLALRWFWQYDIDPGDEFTARVRVSTSPVSGLDLVGDITEYNFVISGASTGFEMYETLIPLLTDIRSFDITFISGGTSSATGMFFIDDISAAVVLAGDLNGDGFVGINDLNIVLGHWNQLVPSGDLLRGDPTGDGFIGIEDLNTVLSNWNAGTPPGEAASNIPEPIGLSLLSTGCLALLSRRSFWIDIRSDVS